jgi:hypothetical protein
MHDEMRLAVIFSATIATPSCDASLYIVVPGSGLHLIIVPFAKPVGEWVNQDSTPLTVGKRT